MRRMIGWFGSVMFSTALLIQPAFAFHEGVGAGVLPIVPVEMAQRLLDAGEHPIFIDLRPAEEFKAGRLPGARSIPFWDVLKRYTEIPRTGRISVSGLLPYLFPYYVSKSQVKYCGR